MTTRSSAFNQTRLKHGNAAWLRTHQTSSTQLYIYVEGKNNDRSYYEKVVRATLASSNISYLFELSRNIPGVGEGKQALLRGFEIARKGRLLRNEFTGKKTALVFFLDKDVDEITHCRKKSSSLCYTTKYCVENHIISESAVGHGIALACSADPSVICSALGNEAAWLNSKVSLQEDWLSLCLLAKTKDIKVANYGTHASPINIRLTGPTDPILYAQQLAYVQNRSTLSASEFDKALKSAKKMVKSRISSGNHDTIFKGKWYTPFLEEIALKLVGKDNFNETVFRHSIWTSLVAEVNPTNQGSSVFRAAVQDAIDWISEK